jgi:hypothetical protein
MTEKDAEAASKELGQPFRVGLTTVQPDIDNLPELPPCQLLRQISQSYGIPKIEQYRLFARILLARSLSEDKARQLCVAIRLMAITVLGRASFRDHPFIRCFALNMACTLQHLRVGL